MKEIKLNGYLKEVKRDLGKEYTKFAILLTENDNGIMVTPSANVTAIEWVKLIAEGTFQSMETIVLSEALKAIKEQNMVLYHNILNGFKNQNYHNLNELLERLGE